MFPATVDEDELADMPGQPSDLRMPTRRNVVRAVLDASVRRFVSLSDIPGDSPTVRDVITRQPSPLTYVGELLAIGALPRSARTAVRSGRTRTRAPSCAYIGRHRVSQTRRMLGCQVDLIAGPTDGERHRLVCSSTVEVVLESDLNSFCHAFLLKQSGMSATLPGA